MAAEGISPPAGILLTALRRHGTAHGSLPVRRQPRRRERGAPATLDCSKSMDGVPITVSPMPGVPMARQRWAHPRRKFYELHVSGVSHVASETVEQMTELWKVEERIHGHNPQDRRTARQGQSGAIVAELWPFWEKVLSHISGTSKLAEAIRYARSRREALERFLNDGHLDIDSNAVERAMRCLPDPTSVRHTAHLSIAL